MFFLLCCMCVPAVLSAVAGFDIGGSFTKVTHLLTFVTHALSHFAIFAEHNLIIRFFPSHLLASSFSPFPLWSFALWPR